MRSLDINKRYVGTGRRSQFFFRYFLLFALLIFCIFQFNIYKVYGFSLYPDEFGYWASAAEILGYDWTDTAALGSYYSYGYGLLLAPILWFFHDCVTAYRAAIAVNILLQCGMMGMLWGIFRRLYHAEASEERKMQLVLAIGTAIFYPPVSFYTQMTMAETLLAFLYILICYQITLFVEKPNVVGAVLIALPLLYIYFVHMRTVGVVLAAVITLLLYAWRNPAGRKALAIAVVILAVGALCGLWVKGRVTDTVYAQVDTVLLSLNDYTGQLVKLKRIFSFPGMKQLLLSSIGKLYYLIMASFGLVFPAIYFCLKKTFGMLGGYATESTDCHRDGYVYLFCLLSLVGQFVISVIAGISPGRLDEIVYGRYNEYMLPIFIGIGLMMFCDTERKLRVFGINVCVSVILFGITYWNVMRSGLTAMQGYFAAGISYLSDDWHYDVTTEFLRAFALGIFLMAFVMVCVYTGKRFGKYIYVLAAVLLMEILLTLCLNHKYTKQFNDVDYNNLRIYQYMAGNEESVSYLYDGGFPYIDLIQFAMKDRKIEIIRLEEVDSLQMQKDTTESGSHIESGIEIPQLDNVLPGEGFLIVDRNCKYLEEIEQRYEKCTESRAFILFQAE